MYSQWCTHSPFMSQFGPCFKTYQKLCYEICIISLLICMGLSHIMMKRLISDCLIYVYNSNKSPEWIFHYHFEEVKLWRTVWLSAINWTQFNIYFKYEKYMKHMCILSLYVLHLGLCIISKKKERSVLCNVQKT